MLLKRWLVRWRTKKKEDLDVLSSWYVISTDGVLVSLNTQTSFYLNIRNYLASTMKPTISEGKLKIDVSVFSKLK